MEMTGERVVGLLTVGMRLVLGLLVVQVVFFSWDLPSS